MKVLMIGATGEYAGLVVPELTKRGVVVRALVRDGNGEEAARGRGAAETALGNLEEPESLRAAAQGVDGVFHIAPAFAPDEATMGVAMVSAAREAGVRKFVFSGILHPSFSRMSNHAAKLPVEEAIYESGMTFTVLQPAMFLQNFDAGWSAVREEGVFALPYSRRVPACYVDYRDVAEAAALALTGDRLDFGTFELCAAGMWDRTELATMMGDALGRNIEATEPDFDEWADKAHLPGGPLRDGMRAMYAHYDRYGFPGGNALALRAILGREPRTLPGYFRELATRAAG